MSRFSRGDMVYLRSDKSVEGAVVDIQESDAVTSYTVYIGEKGLKTYYETQLAAKAKENTFTAIDRDTFDAIITAALINDPSMSSLYSINSAKIDFIPHQFRPVLKFIRSDRPRLLIADGVGVGKTIEAGLILREMQARRNIESVLIICPRPLITEQKWEREMRRFDQVFEPMNGEDLRYCLRETRESGIWPDRFSKAVIPFSLFDEKNVMGKSSSDAALLNLENPPKFDLVIVDEAHHIRNTKTYAYAAVKHFCDNAEAVVFLTATPVQLEYDDLFVMMNLLRPDLIINKDVFHDMAEPNEYINKAATAIRNRNENWEDTAVRSLETALYHTNWGNLVLSKNPIAYNVLTTLLDGDVSDEERVRLISDVENLHTFSNMISRTRRRDIGEFTIRKTITVTVDFTPEQKKLHDEVLKLSASIMVTLHGDANVKFLLTTIRRQTASCIFGLVPFLRDILSRHIDDLDDCMYIDEIEDADSEVERVFYDEAVNKIEEIIEFAENLNDYDPKYLSLVDIINEKQKSDKNKIMIFSSFRHTLHYLFERLKNEGIRAGLIHGDVSDEDRRELRRRFELDRMESDALDVLLFSEVGCEGLDYQFCDCMVNYDLPWNPMRIEQRIGRIDRNGQKSESVSIYNLVTPGTVDYDIYDRCTSRIGVFKQSIGDCEEILGSLSSDIMNIVENTTLNDEDRRAKLQQLADNKIRMVQEQIQLEDKQKDLFGIRLPENAFRKDVENATNCWLMPDSIQNLLRIYLKECADSDKEYITGEKDVKDMRLSQKAREKLLYDFESCDFPKSIEYKNWEKMLHLADLHIPVTFLPEAAEERDAILITLSHPFVKQAAKMLSKPEKPVSFFRVTADSFEKGTYPFIMYQWMYSGDHEDVVLKPLSSNNELNKQLLKLLKNSECCDCDFEIEESLWEKIESLHHNLWDCELQKHRINSSELINYKLGTLATAHQSRISFIRDMIRKSTNTKIRMMREAELRNANADFEQRKRHLEQTMEKVDIVASKLAYGIIIVE